MMLDTIWQGAQHVCNAEVPKNSSRRAEHVRVRWLAMYAAKRKGFSYVSIGRFFGVDHTTVIHGVLSFEKLGLHDLSRELVDLERYIDAPPERKAMLEKLPIDREGITLHFVITTMGKDFALKDVDGYVQTGQYPDGRLGELFIKVGKQGDHHALLDQWAISTSIALQHGAPVEELLGKFVASRFEPSGAVTGVEGIKRCTSPLDLVARFLLAKYGRKEP